jgi:hypothetical protein
MTYGDPLSTSIPAVGAAGTGYATSINARLAEIEAILESDVPYSSLTGSELDLNNVPIRDATYVELYEGASTPGASPVGRLARYQNNLYWVTDEGAVRITLDGALDASSVGGIGGDYGGGNPALVSFSDGTSVYEFYDDSNTLTWAYVRSRGLDIADGAATTDVIRLRAPAIAASYDFTFPTALPGSNRSVLVISSAGAVEPNDSTNTITNTVRCGANVDINLSGTGTLVHGEREFTVTLGDGIRQAVSGVWSTAGCNGMGIQSTTAGQAYFQISGFQRGWKLKAVKVTTNKTSTGTTTVQIGSGSFGNFVSFGSNTDATSGDRTITVTSTDTSSFVTGQGLALLITTGNNNDKLFQAGIVYEQASA